MGAPLCMCGAMGSEQATTRSLSLTRQEKKEGALDNAERPRLRSIRATTPGGELHGMRKNVTAVTARAFAM